jgi:predicted transcriptional regulator
MKAGNRAAAWTLSAMLLLGALVLLPAAEARTPAVQVEMGDRVIKVDASISQSMVASFGGSVVVSNNANQPATVDLSVVAGDWASAVEINPSQKIVTGDGTLQFTAVVTVAPQASEGTYSAQVVARAETPGSAAAVSQNITAIRLVRNRLGVECDRPVLQAAAGQTVTFPVRVYNNGSTRDTIAPALGRIAGRMDRFSYLLQEGSLDIEADGFVYFNVNLTLSPNATAGSYTILFTAQSSASSASGAEQVLTAVIPAKAGTGGAPPGPDYKLWFGISIIIVGACLMVFLGGTEIGFLALLQFILVPLFVRLKKDQVLDHFTRGQIFGFIKANPGAHYIAVQEHLELQNGVLAYHLKVLEREEYITSERDGIYRRFYPRHMKIPHKERQLTRVQRDIVEALKAHPGTSQNGLARLIGESKQVVGYHVRVLEKAGLVRVERDAQQTRCFLEGAPLEVEPEPEAPSPEPDEHADVIKEIHA